jgi:hypothetical protein
MNDHFAAAAVLGDPQVHRLDLGVDRSVARTDLGLDLFAICQVCDAAANMPVGHPFSKVWIERAILNGGRRRWPSLQHMFLPRTDTGRHQRKNCAQSGE